MEILLCILGLFGLTVVLSWLMVSNDEPSADSYPADLYPADSYPVPSDEVTE